MNKTALIIIILIIIVGGYFFFSGGYQAPTPAPEVSEPILFPESTPESEPEDIGEGILPPLTFGTEIQVSGTEFSFTPSNITVEPFKEYKLVFTNNGTISHNWIVDGKDKIIGLETRTIGPGETVSFTFDVPPGPDTYTVYCSVPGHREAGMIGTLTVE